MPFSSTAVSSVTRLSQPSRLVHVLVIGPELLANALHALLATIDDFFLLSPIFERDEVLPFIECVRSAAHPIDVVVLHSSGDLEADHTLLHALSTNQHRCLIVTSLHFPNEMALIKQNGAWGLLLTASPVTRLAAAVRSIARGSKSFPESFPAMSASKPLYLTKPRQMVFHEERLEALAREMVWKLTHTERNLFRHITDPSIQEIATNIHLRPTTVRRELSERVYEFLELISGRPVSNRFLAIQVLHEYGVIEYVLPPPST